MRKKSKESSANGFLARLSAGVKTPQLAAGSSPFDCHRVGVPIRDWPSTREQRTPIIHVEIIMWNVTDPLIASSIDFNLAGFQCFGSISTVKFGTGSGGR